MREMKGICDTVQNTKSKSLVRTVGFCSVASLRRRTKQVIIDELGRSTSHEEGVAIAWSFCVRFDDHYSQLPGMLFRV